jgi:hypothetical protein
LIHPHLAELVLGHRQLMFEANLLRPEVLLLRIEPRRDRRHLAKYIEPVQPGFVAAVRAIFNAYEDHPNGEQQFPPIPVNFGN